MLAGFARKLPKNFKLKGIGVCLSLGRYRIVFAILNRTPARASALRGVGVKPPLGLGVKPQHIKHLAWHSENAMQIT